MSSSPDSMRVVKLWRVGWGMWHIIRRRKGPHGRCSNTYVVSIKYDLEEVESEFLTGLNWLVTGFSDHGNNISDSTKNISRRAE